MLGSFTTKLKDYVIKNIDFDWTKSQQKWLNVFGFNFVEFLKKVKFFGIHIKTFNRMKDVLNIRLRTLYNKDT